MPKRTKWLATGVAIGAGGSLWAQRKAKSAAARYGPLGLLGAAAGRLRGALAEGRSAMREREAELKQGSPANGRPDEPASRAGSASKHSPSQRKGRVSSRRPRNL